MTKILLEALFWKNSASDLRHTLKLEEGEWGKNISCLTLFVDGHKEID